MRSYCYCIEGNFAISMLRKPPPDAKANPPAEGEGGYSFGGGGALNLIFTPSPPKPPFLLIPPQEGIFPPISMLLRSIASPGDAKAGRGGG